MSMTTKIKLFFSPKRQYVVAGATPNTAKFGYKIFTWYILHDLPVIPVNPKTDEISNHLTVRSVSDIVKAFKESSNIRDYSFTDRDGLSISFLTPPNVTSQILKEISSVKGFRGIIKGLWFQPGSYDEDVLEVSRKIGLGEKVVFENECILKKGEFGLSSANL